MRLIKLLVSEDTKQSVVDVLEAENIDFVVTKDATEHKNDVLVEFPLPTQAVGYVIDELRDAGVNDKKYTVIASAETAKTRNYHELEERFVAGVEEDDAVAREEIRAKALDMHRSNLTYYSMTMFSAIVAAAGLLMDSPAVVVGAMVIAPQVGSALIAGVGISLNDRRMIRIGFAQQFFGFGAAILGAFVLGLLLQSGQIVTSVLDVSTVSQISKRISPGLLSLLVGLCAGAAGAFGLATALPVSLVGVMIAAALIPAAAAIGIGLAWGLPSVYLGAGVLLVANAVAVNVSAFLVLWYFGYRPDSWTENTREVNNGESTTEPNDRSQYLGAAVALVLLGSIFVGAGGLLVGQIGFDNDVNTAVEQVMADDQYSDLELTSMQTEVGMSRYFGQTPEVTVVVMRPADESYPDLAETLREQIRRETGRNVAVSVEFREGQRVGNSLGDPTRLDAREPSASDSSASLPSPSGASPAVSSPTPTSLSV
ncbi:TIGR00341 family protein [Haloprofundus halobius]|uniref:TIGR00341 family protein n=1 Tax=Haloprofundus halobius TaxID=2876194 RepID=UPI001CCBF3EE|nr:TIGR00341 family protein [Haloprofundus halobius]